LFLGARDNFIAILKKIGKINMGVGFDSLSGTYMAAASRN
jgi:hypothetical protein